MKNDWDPPPDDDNYKAKVCATPIGPCAEVESKSPLKTFLIASGIGVVFLAGVKLFPKLLRGLK